MRRGRAARRENAARPRVPKPTIFLMSGTPEPIVCIDSATGREVYAPTGETVDEVVTVVAAADQPCLAVSAQAAPPDARWGLLGALLLVGLGAGLARRLSRPLA
jgi:hypothetical protein